MKKLLLLVASVLTLMSLTACSKGGLGTFGADFGKKASPIPGGSEIRLPYTDLSTYYGYVKPGSEPDAVVNGKKFFYIYVWVPVVAPELGVRMLSPVPKGMAPAEGDFKGSLWAEAAADAESYFDTYITFEKASGIIAPAQIKEAGMAKWNKLAYNDDSSEMPKNPGGRPYNSLLRYTSEVSNPTKALIRGLYRIGFTTYKRGEVEGSFLAQVGAPIKLPGVVVSDSLEVIMKSAK